MGNGESTSRRISMQRSDEGTIQVYNLLLWAVFKFYCNLFKTVQGHGQIFLLAGTLILSQFYFDLILDF